MQNNNNIETPVLIIGGGITGLSAALFLLDNGIKPVLIEKHAGTSIHPRSRGFDVRTMELYRELGLMEKIKDAGKELAHAWGILKGENLMAALELHGETIGKIKTPFQLTNNKQKPDEISPAAITRCTQDIAEPILLSAVRERGAAVYFNHEMIEFRQVNGKISTMTKNRETGNLLYISADYMISADGANSQVRTLLKSETVGQSNIADFLNIYFEAPLGNTVRGREFSLYLIDEPEITGIFTTINNNDKWVLQLKYYPEQGEKPEDYNDKKIISILRKTIGKEDIDIKIISVLPWQMGTLAVKNMQYQNIFLAGDAAHKMTPFGGKGANTGVQDVHNLAWKLAAVVKGYAQKPLLNSYSVERQPVGEKYALLSGELANEKGLLNMDLLTSQIKKFVGTVDYIYRSDAIVGDTNFQDLLCKPGTVIPHLWLGEDKKISTLNLVKNRFLLLGKQTEKQTDLTPNATTCKFGFPLLYYTFKDDGIWKKWKELTAMQDNELILVRPDGFISWRGAWNNLNLEKVMKQILTGNN